MLGPLKSSSLGGIFLDPLEHNQRNSLCPSVFSVANKKYSVNPYLKNLSALGSIFLDPPEHSQRNSLCSLRPLP
jgi:hypothetical protein